MSVQDAILKRSFVRGHRALLALILGVAGAVVIGLLAVEQPLLTVGVVLGGLLVLAMIKWPDLATLLVVFYLYTNIGPVAIRFHGLPTSLGMAFPLLLAVPLVWHLVIRREKLVITPVLYLMLALLGIYAVGAAFSRDFELALPELTEFFIEGVILFFLLTNVIRTPAMLKRVVWVLLIAGALIGGLSLYQQATGTFENNYGGFAQVDKAFGTDVENLQGEIQQPRLAGSIGEKNRYAQVMLMLVPLGLFFLGTYSSKAVRALLWILTGLIVIGGALAFSRGAAVAFILMILIMLFQRYIKLHQLVLLILSAWLIVLMFPQYGVRLASLGTLFELTTPGNAPVLSGSDGAIKERATELVAAVEVFKDHPLFGVGPGMFRYYTQEYAREIGITTINKNYKAHSLFPGIAADAGLLGLVCFVLILFLPLRALAQARKRWMDRRPDLAYLAMGFFQVLISYMVTGLFLHLSYMRFLYLMVALAVVAGRLATEDATVESNVTESNEESPSLLQGRMVTG